VKVPELLRQRNFRLFFEGQSVSLLGDEISMLAIPLTAILVLHAGPEQLGLLTAMSVLPSLLFSLVAGAALDRRGRRRSVMLMADWIRGAAMLSLPIAYALGHLTLIHLYAVAFVIGTLDVLFFVSYNAMIVALVRPHEYVEANALLNGSRSLAGVLGLTLGGTLVAVLTAPGALLVDAVSFLYSGVQIARTDPTEPPSDPTQSHGVSHGARWIAGNPLVRAMLASTATVNLFTFLGKAILVLYASRILHLRPALIGLAFGAGALGGVVGAITARRLEHRIGLGRAFVVGSFLFPLPWLLFPAAHGTHALVLGMLGAGEFASSVGVIWLDIAAAAIFAQEIPEHLLSRVAGAYRTVNYGVRPLGAVIGGFLGASIGLRNALWVAAIGASCAGLPLLRRAVLNLRSATPPKPATQATVA
jgi:MFS family permease